MKGERKWFIKCEMDGKHFLTLFEDAYLMNEKGKKMFVLQKAAMQQVRNLVQEYSITDDGSNDEPKLTIKCNISPIYTCHNKDFGVQLANLILNNDNIKHPTEELSAVIDKIWELDAAGTVSELIDSKGKDGFIQDVIESVYENIIY